VIFPYVVRITPAGSFWFDRLRLTLVEAMWSCFLAAYQPTVYCFQYCLFSRILWGCL